MEWLILAGEARPYVESKGRHGWARKGLLRRGRQGGVGNGQDWNGRDRQTGNGQDRNGRDRQHRWGSDLQGIKGKADKAGTREVRCGGDWQSRKVMDRNYVAGFFN